jgi:hypothetical protein
MSQRDSKRDEWIIYIYQCYEDVTHELEKRFENSITSFLRRFFWNRNRHFDPCNNV